MDYLDALLLFIIKKYNEEYDWVDKKLLESESYMFNPGLSIGEILKNSDIIDTFKCGNMGGMRRSKTTNTLVLISDILRVFIMINESVVSSSLYRYVYEW